MKLFAFISLLFVSISLYGQANDNKIYYIFSDSVKSAIQKVLIEKKIKQEASFILYSELPNGNKSLLLNNCDKCPLFSLIQKSNRYVKLEKFNIPIIFRSDLTFTIIINEKNRAIFPNIGGWQIEITNKREVVSVSLIQ